MFAFRENAEVGGFIVCAACLVDLSPRTVLFVDRIRGAYHIRADHQREDREDTRPHATADAARRRESTDGIFGGTPRPTCTRHKHQMDAGTSR